MSKSEAVAAIVPFQSLSDHQLLQAAIRLISQTLLWALQCKSRGIHHDRFFMASFTVPEALQGHRHVSDPGAKADALNANVIQAMPVAKLVPNERL